MTKTYQDLGGIEGEVLVKSPPIICKYRDRSNQYHKEMLIGTAIWFAHPKTLNDPYDIRTPVRFDYSEIEHPLFFEKLKSIALIRHPEISPNTRDFMVICENQMDIIRVNPVQYFEANALAVRAGSSYDSIGIISFSQNELDEAMWAHYGNNGQGFCIGFDTVKLCKALQCGFGFVNYQAQPPLHSFIANDKDNQMDLMFLKHPKWSNEKEYRFFTARISSDKDREVFLAPDMIVEVVLGPNITEKHKDEIIEVLKARYNSSPQLFKCESVANSYGYVKKQIKY